MRVGGISYTVDSLQRASVTFRGRKFLSKARLGVRPVGSTRRIVASNTYPRTSGFFNLANAGVAKKLRLLRRPIKLRSVVRITYPSCKSNLSLSKALFKFTHYAVFIIWPPGGINEISTYLNVYTYASRIGIIYNGTITDVSIF